MDLTCKHQHAFLSMNFIMNVTAISIPEEIIRHSWRQQPGSIPVLVPKYAEGYKTCK